MPYTDMRKPGYMMHRTKLTAADTTNLALLLTNNPRTYINCKGFDTLHGFVKFTGGTVPTITLQPLERVNYIDPSGAEARRFVVRGSNTSALSDGDSFEFATNGGGLWFMRAHAVTGSPTAVEIYVVGGTRANEASI